MLCQLSKLYTYISESFDNNTIFSANDVVSLEMMNSLIMTILDSN